MWPENIDCSPAKCALFGMMVVLILVLIFRKEKFDTSVGVRSQVGDSTNLDTTLGTSGSFPGDVYNCSQPILMIQPDNAYTWGDSKDYIDDKSLAFAKSIGKGIENMGEPLKELTPSVVDKLTPDQVLMVLKQYQDAFPDYAGAAQQPTISPVDMDAFKSAIRRLVFARQNAPQNLKIMVPRSWGGENLQTGMTYAEYQAFMKCRRLGGTSCFTDGINSFDQNVFNKSGFEPFASVSDSSLGAVGQGLLNDPSNYSIVSHLRDNKPQ
jgi:hypothetical protein